MRYPVPIETRFWPKVKPALDDSGCWLWGASQDGHGYGQICSRHGQPPIKAYRVAYALLRGPVPESLQLDHLCRNKLCVNPEHLEAVTARENTLRSDGITAQFARQTHCKRGHEYNAENTTYRSRGDRECRVCQREMRAAGLWKS